MLTAVTSSGTGSGRKEESLLPLSDVGLAGTEL